VEVTNFWSRYTIYRIVCAAFQLLDIGGSHPARTRSRRELERTVDYIESNMPNAIGFDTQKEVLDYALSQTTVAGGYLEAGVFRGGTIRYIEKRLRRMGKSDAIIHGFDSFEGLPEAWAGGSYLGRSAFSTRGKLPRVPRNVVLHKGWFSETILKWRASFAIPIAFLHVDCDIYSSTVEILEGLCDRMQVGTVIVFDEYFNYPNWRQHEFRAWREFVDRHNLTYEYLAFARNQVAIRICAIGTAASARKGML
jgi:Macrocin-O-methyltransferase (TylF)